VRLLLAMRAPLVPSDADLSLLHIVAATLRDDAAPDAVQAALSLAHEMADAEGVRASFAARSPTQLVAGVWLDDARALEPFAASEEHMSFVMRGLASVITGMWSASLACAEAPPSHTPDAVWLFAIPEFEGVFEWEVRRLLDDVAGLPGMAWVGPTVEERERYRAGGVVLLAAEESTAFGEALSSARGSWQELGERLQEAFVTGAGEVR